MAISCGGYFLKKSVFWSFFGDWGWFLFKVIWQPCVQSFVLHARQRIYKFVVAHVKRKTEHFIGENEQWQEYT